MEGTEEAVGSQPGAPRCAIRELQGRCHSSGPQTVGSPPAKRNEFEGIKKGNVDDFRHAEFLAMQRWAASAKPDFFNGAATRPANGSWRGEGPLDRSPRTEGMGYFRLARCRHTGGTSAGGSACVGRVRNVIANASNAAKGFAGLPCSVQGRGENRRPAGTDSSRGGASKGSGGLYAILHPGNGRLPARSNIPKALGTRAHQAANPSRIPMAGGWREQQPTSVECSLDRTVRSGRKSHDGLRNLEGAPNQRFSKVGASPFVQGAQSVFSPY
uniref:Uncharacterized protein n=1 Tax=Trichuris muris TaxID=70415 RepID=A0A5S6QW22_TRIMR